jgi:hypothetical protein
MNIKRQTAILAILDELEIRAVYLRVGARKYQRDVDILGALMPKIPLEALPHLRRAIRQRLQSLGDAMMGEQEVLASQDFYQVYKQVNSR